MRILAYVFVCICFFSLADDDYYESNFYILWGYLHVDDVVFKVHMYSLSTLLYDTVVKCSLDSFIFLYLIP